MMHGSDAVSLVIGASLASLAACTPTEQSTDRTEPHGAREQPAPASSDVDESEVAGDYVLYESRCGQYVIQGVGLEPFDDFSPSYGTKALVVRSDAGESRTWTPPGGLYFSDWGWEPCSPDGEWVVFLLDHYGPIDVVKRANLAAYLDGGSADRIISGTPEDWPHAQVHDQLSWKPPSTLMFETGGSPPMIHEVVLE